MEHKLGEIAKWLSDSGMKVSEQKTELCLFYKEDTASIMVNLNERLIKSNKNINVLGVVFNSKYENRQT